MTVPSTAADLSDANRLFRTGKYAECVEASGKTITDDASNTAPRMLKIRAEMELGRYGDALQTLNESLDQFPENIQLLWLAHDVYRFNQQSDQLPKLDQHLDELLDQNSWRYRDPANQVVVGRYYLSQGVDPKKVLDDVYNEVKKRRPDFAEVFLACGDLALEKGDYALAAQSFEQVVKLDPDDPQAYFGLVQAYAPSDPAKATSALRAALERNPHHVRSLLFLADEHIDSERYDDADRVLAQVAEVNPSHPIAAAYRAVLAHLRGQPEQERLHRILALRHWPQNPAVDSLIGQKLSQKYRFAEGAAYQRQALELDPNYLPAKIQLAQDLLRLGQEAEGWQLAEEAYNQDGYNVLAHNLATLHDNLSKFRALERDGFIVRMDPREAEIYGGRVLDLLQRARRQLSEKYEVTIDKPVTVELFPKQQDFAIRTFGLPGGAGFLAVCFGTVITANSPASQTASPTCWESTLWHEFCHVITLNKTHNKMPRWLSEGISVYEERQADPSWGETLNPHYRAMLLADDLTPVSRLSGAFLDPPSPLHLQFAYYESSLVVEFLVDRYGIEALRQILVDLAKDVPINDALARHAGALETLDADFARFARERAAALAPDADWSEPDLPRRADAATIAAWVQNHPHNYVALQRLAAQQMAEQAWAGARSTLEEMLRLYPQDVGPDNAYGRLARVCRELGENQQERTVLEKLAELSDHDVDGLARLTELTSQAGDWELTRKYALRWLAVDPLQPAPHRRAAAAAEQLGDDALAVESYRALLVLDPFDPAGSHLHLAAALRRTGDLADAKRHVLWALDEAPRFREAHQLLLEIMSEMESHSAPEKSAGSPAAAPGNAPVAKEKPP